MSIVSCTDLSFSWPDGTEVFNDISFSLNPERVGLVGDNGSGKTTLLKIMAGEITPKSGSVTVNGILGYLPQDIYIDPKDSVKDVLGITSILRAITKVEKGKGTDEDFLIIGNEWDIKEKSYETLSRLGLARISISDQVSNLSGGEVISLGLAALLLKKPDALLLDEPTNNLDNIARAKFYDFVEKWKGGVLVVSHDRELLDRMQIITELYDSGIESFTGNYSEFTENRLHTQQVLEATLVNARKELKGELKDRQLNRERSERKINSAIRNIPNLGLPKGVLDGRKKKAEETAGKNFLIHDSRVNSASEKVSNAQDAVRSNKTIDINQPKVDLPNGRTVFSGTNIQIKIGERNLYSTNGISLSIVGPELVVLTGKNGSGKSSLLKVIAKQITPTEGKLYWGEGRIAYLTQKLEVPDDELSILENFRLVAKSLEENERRNILAHFLFPKETVHKQVKILSGGERLRVCLMLILFSENPPELLLLDEPTNNLDIASTEQLENLIQNFTGACIVVSHDKHFMENIKPDRRIHIQDGI